MSQNCEMLEKCGFFMNFKGNSEVVKKGWITIYCKNIDKSLNCERKKFRQLKGTPPADNMTPTGKIL